MSICTAALAWQSFVLSGSEADFNIISIVFLSTLFIYCFHRYVKRNNQRDKKYSDSFKTYKKIITIIGGIAFLLLLPFLYFISLRSKIFFLIAGLLALWYTIGIIKTKEEHLTLRRVPFLKLFLIAGIWTLMTVSFPLFEESTSENYWLLIIERFLFILAITIPFDIRDMVSDKNEGIRTFPLLMGIKTMKIVSIIIAVLFILTSIYGSFIGLHQFKETLALVFSGILTIYMLRKVKQDNHPFYYSLGMEGMSLVQSMVVILTSLF